MVQENCKVMRY